VCLVHYRRHSSSLPVRVRTRRHFNRRVASKCWTSRSYALAFISHSRLPPPPSLFSVATDELLSPVDSSSVSCSLSNSSWSQLRHRLALLFDSLAPALAVRAAGAPLSSHHRAERRRGQAASVRLCLHRVAYLLRGELLMVPIPSMLPLPTHRG
jgi:hypothetical protein